MLVEYIGNKKDYTLYPPYVAEKTAFKANKAEIDDEYAKPLIAENPNSFREVQTPIPDVLTKSYLQGLKGRDGIALMERIGVERHGVAIKSSDGKKKMIETLLALQEQAE